MTKDDKNAVFASVFKSQTSCSQPPELEDRGREHSEAPITQEKKVRKWSVAT